MRMSRARGSSVAGGRSIIAADGRSICGRDVTAGDSIAVDVTAGDSLAVDVTAGDSIAVDVTAGDSIAVATTTRAVGLI